MLSDGGPLWARLRDALRARILGGEWPEGTLVPPETQLCETYGVSRITATRALNELVREGLVVRQRGRGTTVAPRGMEGPRALGFVTSRLDFEWALDVYSGFERAAAQAQHVSLLTSTHGSLTLEAPAVRSLLDARARALALQVRPTPEALALLENRAGRRVPFAFVGTYDPEIEADRVTADNVEAGLVATRHLLALGHRRIAFVGPSADWLVRNTSYRDRLAGYHAALREAAGSLDPAVRRDPDRLVLGDGLPEAMDGEARRDHLLTFLEESGATAAVTTTDTLAVLLTRLLRAAGVRVPEHLAIAGIGDERVAALVDVPLTTVRISAPALGENATRLLLHRLEGDTSPPTRVVVPVRLVVRASCGAREKAIDGEEDGGIPGGYGARNPEAALRSPLA